MAIETIANNYSSTDSHVPGLPQTVSPLRLKSPTPVHLYWVKNQEAPVLSIPPDYLHESYHSLRAKALKQRHAASLGTTPYDMDVLYQFWSHFLLRNFNTQMYDEFRYFAFQDATDRVTDVGLSNLVKFYGESLLSSQGKIREKVARHFIDLVQMQNRLCLPAFRQLRSAFRDGTINPPLRKLIVELLDDSLLASLAA
jgi:la-related protein 1